MDTISLKKYIYDNQKIEFVLDEIGCKTSNIMIIKSFIRVQTIMEIM